MPHYWRPIPAGVGEAAWRLRVTNDPDVIVNLMGFDFDTEPTAATANQLFTYYATRLMPLLSNAVTLESVHILYQSDATHQIVQDSTNTAVAGGKSGAVAAMVPVNCAFLLRKRTGFAGKRERGRMYLPGVTEADMDGNGAVSATMMTAAGTATTGFYSDIATYHPVLLHSVLCDLDQGHTGAHTATPPPPSPVTSLEFDDRVATQRRRLNR